MASSSLGVPGYTFADLHDPERLASFYERFCEEVEAADPVFWREWDAYRQAPDAPRPPVALSNLLIGDGAARQPVRHAAVRRRAPAAAHRRSRRAPRTISSASRSTSCAAARCRC